MQIFPYNERYSLTSRHKIILDGLTRINILIANLSKIGKEGKKEARKAEYEFLEDGLI